MAPQTFDKTNQKGIVLVSVLIVSAIGLGICVLLLSLAVTQARSIVVTEQLYKAKAYADTCAEYALNALHLSSAYAGSETLAFSDGSCQILSVLGTGSSNRTIRAKGLVGDALSKGEIVVSQTAPTLLITSWQDVADFSSP